jgi:hypothetical protein
MQKSYASQSVNPRAKSRLTCGVLSLLRPGGLYRLLLFLICLSAGTIGRAQAPAIAWQKALGGSSSDNAYSIQQTTDGGYVVAGFSFSTDGEVSGNHGGTDYWIVKLDASGNLQWQKSLGGSLSDFARSIQQTTDGGYIVAGYSTSTDGDVSSNHGGTDYWVVKLDASGNLQWEKPLGGSFFDYAISILQTSDGAYVVAGSSASFDDDVSGNHGLDDFWVVKLDAGGAIQWQKTLGGSGEDVASSVQQTSDGGYIVAGYSDSNDGDVSGNHGDVDDWIVKLDASGAIQWQKSLGGSFLDYASSVQQTTDGGYIVAGYSASGDGDVSGHHGGIGPGTVNYFDYWIVKLDAGGAIQWQKALGGSSGDFAYSIQQTTDGGYVVAGSSLSTDGDVNGNKEGVAWVVKLHSDGGDLRTWYHDADGDGFGDPAVSQQASSQPPGYVADNTDCNDADASEHPGQTWYIDHDEDQYGGSSVSQCVRPSHGFLQTELQGLTDCTDNDAAIYVPVTSYRDADGDGFGAATNFTSVCSSTPPFGYVPNSADCDDSKVLFKDADGDGYGSTVKVACGGVANNWDSNDGDGKSMVYVCHKGATLVINAHALKAHLNHGDAPGACTAASLTQRSSQKTEADQDLPLGFGITVSPNPFSGNAHIRYTLPLQARVSLNVYDLQGRLLGVVVSGERAAGLYRIEYNMSKLAQGTYYCRMMAVAGGEVFSQIQTLVKTQ